MIVLGIDTATPGLSVALVGPEGTIGSFADDAGRRHTELLAPAIEDLCRRGGVSLGEVDAFAVDVGPGLFTGLRVGLATVSALASALDRPAVGLQSTEILAEPVREASRDVVAVVDVRRSEVAWAYFPATPPAGAPEPALAQPAALAEILAGLRRPGHPPVTVVGDGALRYRDVLEAGAGGAISIETAAPYPSALAAATLARRRLLDGTLTPGPVHAVYLRQADVHVGWASRDLPPGVTSHAAGRSRQSAERV